QYHVDRRDWEEKKAYVRPVKVDYYTDANLAVSIKVLETFASRPAAELAVHHGEVQIRALATIFKKIRFHSHENIGSGPISLPEQQLHTTAFWLEIPAEVARQFPRRAMQGGLQGVANVVSQVACLFLMCDVRDLGAHPEIRAPPPRRHCGPHSQRNLSLHRERRKAAWPRRPARAAERQLACSTPDRYTGGGPARMLPR